MASFIYAIIFMAMAAFAIYLTLIRFSIITFVVFGISALFSVLNWLIVFGKIK